MKKTALILLLSLVLTLFAACAPVSQELAAPVETKETVVYDDGSYMVVTTMAAGQTTTSVIEGAFQLMPQSSHGQDVYTCNPLSYPTNYEYKESEVRRQEDVDAYSSQYRTTWIMRDGKIYRYRVDIHGYPVYDCQVATKYCSYYSSDDRLLWTMSLTGIFRENSVDRNCDIISTSITVYDQDSWCVLSELESKDISSVYYTVRFARKNLGVTVAEPSYTMELHRDPMGIFH